jgi:hypothetical protein
MIINESEYLLNDKNYIPVECIKSKIVLASTFNHDMNHVIGWQNRYNEKFLKTAAFTIDAAGVVYKHFDPKYLSRYFGKLELDTKVIVILLDNDGWLIKDDEKNEFITWKGDIYNKPNEVFDKRWRNYRYWSPYTQQQFDSAVELVRDLCDEFFIPLNIIGHNTKIEDVSDYHGVIYRSNFDKHYTDLNPSWDFVGFKNKLEEK